MQRRFIVTLATLLSLLIGTVIVVVYARGYRFTLRENQVRLAGTGLLVATSLPDGASIFLNGRLTSATNTTLNLPPGSYDMKIAKDGYLPWEKKLTVWEEIVTKAEATLFPQAPKLESLTASGARNPAVDPTRTRIAFTVVQTSPKKSGIYVLDMAGRPILTLQNAATIIADDTGRTFSLAKLSWSPSGSDLVATISAKEASSSFVLAPDRFNQDPPLELNLDGLKNQWDKEQEEKDRARLTSLKNELAKVIKENFSQVKFSPDETKILYVASQSATIKQIITPPLPGTNSQKEERTIEANKLYVYDIKEDKNFLAASDPGKLASVSWTPDSRHLVFIEDAKIHIAEYDGNNKTVVYAGPFDRTFVAPWPDGSKLVILTNLGSDTITPNLYTISLR